MSEGQTLFSLKAGILAPDVKKTIAIALSHTKTSIVFSILFKPSNECRI